MTLGRRVIETVVYAVFLDKLSKKLGDEMVLKDVSLKIEEGEFYALMGPNGSGKTTLASIMASVRNPTSGTIEIFGQKPEAAKKAIGYIPQENFSSPMLTGKENLMYFAGLLGYSGKKAEKIVDDLLRKVGLFEEASKRVSDYSGGMRKRLEVATVLFPDTRLLILDEPTTGLDPSARRKFLSLIQEQREEKTTILLITHIGADAEIASRVGLIDKGKIVAQNEPERLKKESGLENVVNIETSIKNEKVAAVLTGFSDRKKILETELGYRVFTHDPEETTPKIVRALDEINCKTTKIEIVNPSLEDVFFKLTETMVREVS